MSHIGRISDITYEKQVENKLKIKNSGASIVLPPGFEKGAAMSQETICWRFDGCEEYYLRRCANGIYEKGANPCYMQLTLYIPPDYERKFIGDTVNKIKCAADNMEIKVCQCSVYTADVSEPLVNINIIGDVRQKASNLNVYEGMDIVMAGSAATGGAAVLSKLFKEKLARKFSESFTDECVKLWNFIDAKQTLWTAICKGASYVKAVSWGGVYEALWNLTDTFSLGFTVNMQDIPIWQQVVEVSELFDVDPYGMDGSGSVLIVCDDGKGIAEEMEDLGILSAVIGKLTKGNDKIALNGDEKRYINPVREDELYRVLRKLQES